MKKYTQEELTEILRKHKLWLQHETEGERADLYSADLRYADLSSANLSSADLSAADLSSANLRSANLSAADLRSANLRSANLRSANLSYADLRSADLRSANLRSANLSYANLSSADLRSANLSLDEIRAERWGRLWLAQNTITPIGGFTAFKKVDGDAIVTLQIPADAKRLNAIGSRKIRVSKALVVSASVPDKTEFRSSYNKEFIYRIGEEVSSDFDERVTEECSKGIHCFLTEEEAIQY